MDIQQRRAAFAKRFNTALDQSGKGQLSGEAIVQLLARHGVAATSQTVSNWRNAKYMPKLEQFEGIARMLGVDAGDLAFGKSRTAEPTAAYGGDAGHEQAILDRWALLDEPERKALTQLIDVLVHKERRAGRRRMAKA